MKIYERILVLIVGLFLSSSMWATALKVVDWGTEPDNACFVVNAATFLLMGACVALLMFGLFIVFAAIFTGWK